MSNRHNSVMNQKEQENPYVWFREGNVQKAFMRDRIWFSFGMILFTISPYFIKIRDIVAYQPLLPDYKYIIIVRPYFKIRNMGYCYNYLPNKSTKTGITEEKSETFAIPKPIGYTVQVCVKYQKPNVLCARTFGLIFIFFNRNLAYSRLVESHGVLHLCSTVFFYLSGENFSSI